MANVFERISASVSSLVERVKDRKRLKARARRARVECVYGPPEWFEKRAKQPEPVPVPEPVVEPVPVPDSIDDIEEVYGPPEWFGAEPEEEPEDEFEEEPVSEPDPEDLARFA